MPKSLSDLVNTLLVELLQAHEIDVGDDRPLIDDHDDDAVLDLDADVLEQPGGEQGAKRSSALLVGVGVTHAEGKRGEYRTGIGALQALDSDVSQLERFDRPGGTGEQRRGQGNGQRRLGETGRTGMGRHATASVQAQQAGHIVVKGQ